VLGLKLPERVHCGPFRDAETEWLNGIGYREEWGAGLLVYDPDRDIVPPKYLPSLRRRGRDMIRCIAETNNLPWVILENQDEEDEEEERRRLAMAKIDWLAASHGLTATLAVGYGLVGQRIRVRKYAAGPESEWDWREGEVMSYNTSTGKHTVCYDDTTGSGQVLELTSLDGGHLDVIPSGTIPCHYTEEEDGGGQGGAGSNHIEEWELAEPEYRCL